MHGVEEEEEEERAGPMAGEVETCRRQGVMSREQEGRRKRRGEDQWLVR